MAKWSKSLVCRCHFSKRVLRAKTPKLFAMTEAAFTGVGREVFQILVKAAEQHLTK